MSTPTSLPLFDSPVTVMVSPSRGAVTGPGMAYLREHFHNPGILPPDTGDNR